MDRIKLDYKLHHGEQWGFIRETNSEEYLGWILVHKLPPMIFPPQENDYLDRESYLFQIDRYNQRKNTPYHVLIYELRKDVHERGGYETGDDVRLNENHYFSSIDELEIFVNSIGYSFEDIKHRSEIDAP
jgi:hypothetical protein